MMPIVTPSADTAKSLAPLVASSDAFFGVSVEPFRWSDEDWPTAMALSSAADIGGFGGNGSCCGDASFSMDRCSARERTDEEEEEEEGAEEELSSCREFPPSSPPLEWPPVRA